MQSHVVPIMFKRFSNKTNNLKIVYIINSINLASLQIYFFNDLNT